MDAYAQKRLGLQKTEQCRVPIATERPTPIIVNTIDERSRRKDGVEAEIAYGPKARCVFQLRIANGSLSFISQQPRRSDETARLKSERTEFISCCRDALQSFLITQVVKLAFVLGIKSGHEFIAQSFLCLVRAFVKIPVNHDFVPVRFQRSKPRDKFAVSGEQPLMVIIRHDKN